MTMTNGTTTRIGRNILVEMEGSKETGWVCSVAFYSGCASDVAKDSLRMSVGVMSVRAIDGVWRRKQG